MRIDFIEGEWYQIAFQGRLARVPVARSLKPAQRGLIYCTHLMRRRTLLGWMASLAPAWAQTAAFPGPHAGSLRALAGVVLPSELGSARLDAITDGFVRWVRDYRPGAEMDHGYGFTRLRNKPASPAPVYLRQLAELGPDITAESVTTALDQAKITDLPRTPDGRHVAGDLMAYYFRSSDANDLCYHAAIGRDKCRGLAGSERPPEALR
jgi:hypothetical protein